MCLGRTVTWLCYYYLQLLTVHVCPETTDEIASHTVIAVLAAQYPDNGVFA